MKKNRYRVVFELEPTGWWVIHVPSVKGCHTQARSIAQGHRRIREALSLWVEDAQDAELIDELHIPTKVRQALARGNQAREVAEKSNRKAADTMTKIARQLEEIGLSTRAAAELMGISHQRVHQLLRSA